MTTTLPPPAGRCEIRAREGMNWLAHQRLGYNYRLSELNAALGIAQCQRLDEILAGRRRVAHVYIERLMTNRYLILPTIGDQDAMSWFVFVVRLNDLFEPGDRDKIIQDLRDDGIGCNCLLSADPSSAVHGGKVRLQERGFPRSPNMSPTARSRCRFSQR